MGKKINDPSIPSGLGQVDGSYLLAVAHPATGKIYRLPASLLMGLFKTVTANYTLLLSDWGGNVEVDSTSAVNITVPAGLPTSFFCTIIQKNTGAVTVVAGSGTTLRGGLTLSGQNAVATIMSRASNDFYLFTGGSGSGTTGGGSTQLGTPTVTFGTTTTTSIVVNWSTVTSATNYVVKRNTSNTITGATQIYSGGLLTFTDTGLTTGTTYYYFVIAQATGYTDSNPGSGSMSTSGGLSYTPLNFATQTGLTNSGGIWQGGGGVYASYGLADKKLAASTDGFIVWQYGAVDGESAMLAFDAQNTSQAYSTGHYIAAAYVYQGTIYRIDNGGAVTSTAVTIAVGSYLRIIRTAGVTKVQKSSDAGTTWTDVYTYAGLNAQTYANVDFFVNINIDGTNKCYYPQGSNLI